MKARRLQIGNIKTLQRYLQYVEGDFCKDQILPKVRSLTQKTMNGEIVSICKIEILSKVRFSIALKGEKICRKVRIGEVPYSLNNV